MNAPETEQGQVMLEMSRALAGDILELVKRAFANLRKQQPGANPDLLAVVGVASAGIAFYELLGEAVQRFPDEDRQLARAKLIEWAENTVAGLPTSPLSAPRN